MRDAPLPFRIDWVQWLDEHRVSGLTEFFQAATFLGNVEGYILVVAFVFVAIDKGLAYRLAILALLTMSLNHVLKTWIAQPRPFVSEGSYATRWAVPQYRADELITEFSTPSGHAMAGAAFYGYGAALARRPAMRALAITALLLTGLSRPYLGVHFVEDVALGWALGLALAFAAFRCARPLAQLWARFSPAQQVGLVLGASLWTWALTLYFYSDSDAGPPVALLTYTGFLAGVVVSAPLERRWANFDPRGGSWLQKGLRYLLCVAGVVGTLLVLDEVFAALAGDASHSMWGAALRFLRYAAAAWVGMAVAPWLFIRMRLASQGSHYETARASGPR